VKQFARGLLPVALLFFAVASPGNASAQAVADPFTGLKGRWVWIGHRDQFGMEKACRDNWTQYDVSADRRTINYRYPFEKDGQRQEKAGSYAVLYQDGNSIVMYLDGETRKYKNGDRWVWVLQLENPNLFYWRIFTTSLEQSEGPKYARVRCPG
jgi:hypothetical protein